MSLVDEEALAGGHVPLPDGRVRAPRDHERVVGPHTVYITELYVICVYCLFNTSFKADNNNP